MKKKRTYLSLLFIAFAAGLFAQKGSISGTVIDSTNGEAVPFATIALLKAGETNALTGAISDEAGVFRIENIPNGNKHKSS